MFYTAIWYACPELILNGHIYAGVPPLYKITINKDKCIYLKDDEALETFRKSGASYIEVNRLKGLGEMSEDETDILVDPEQRIIKQITVEDVDKANKLFNDLMGTEVMPRKKFIKEHSKESTIYV